jgi:hypothetical protein
VNRLDLPYVPGHLRRQLAASLKPRTWPWYEFITGLIAFPLWAAVLPEPPFADLGFYDPDLAGFAVLVFTTAAGLLAPILQREIKP